MEIVKSKQQELNIRYTAEQLKARLHDELPIMRTNYYSLSNSKDETFFSLPITVHNISLCVSERAYLFIEPTLRLFKAILPKQKRKFWLSRVKRTDNEREIEKRIAFMEELLKSENALYKEQLEEAKEDIKREKKAQKAQEEAGHGSQSIPPLAERIESFRHVEIDMYEFLYPYMVLVSRGEIVQNEQQVEELRKMHTLAIDIYKEFIPKREHTLETCNAILASDVN